MFIVGDGGFCLQWYSYEKGIVEIESLDEGDVSAQDLCLLDEFEKVEKSLGLLREESLKYAAGYVAHKFRGTLN